MVLLSASVCTKSGKPIVSRQFVELTRSRVEGLLAGFPKLIKEGKQHTFVETDAVRYVYQPLEQLYVVLITTKNSNILEDLETLRTFAKVIPEYCRVLDEREVADHVFELIFAFDEIIALGYRESVNLAQIRSFTEMDSHEEKVFLMQQKNKEREAKEQLKLKMKELERERRNAAKSGRGFGLGGISSNSSMGGMGGMGSMGSVGGGFSSSSSSSSSPNASSMSGISSSSYGGVDSKAFSSKPAPAVSRGMKIGGKPKANELVEQLIAEGETVQDVVATTRSGSSAKAAASAAVAGVPTESVHIRVEEKIIVKAKRDLGLENMEVKGDLFVKITDPAVACIRVALNLGDEKAFQFKMHPNIDKKLFTDDSILALKDPSKPWPVNSELGVVKWRLSTTDESQIPLSVNCWPQAEADGTSVVNIEYELLNTSLNLRDVVITIPLPPRSSPVVGSVDGSFTYDNKASQLYWNVPIVDASNATGSMEFTVPGTDNNAFFPVTVSFFSTSTYGGFKIGGVTAVDGGAPIKYSSDVQFSEETYQFV